MDLQSKKHPSRSTKEHLIDLDLDKIVENIEAVETSIEGLITDISSLTAENIAYDNSTSELEATNVQELGDEIVSLMNLGTTYLRNPSEIISEGALVVGETYEITDYVDPIPVIDNLVGGTGYSDDTAVTTTGGTGTGLTVDITTSAGIITVAVLNFNGTGYTIGDIITIDGGNDDATIEITDILIDDFTNVGALVNETGEIFVATGMTPDSWVNESYLTNSGVAFNTGVPSDVLGFNKIIFNISSSDILGMGGTPFELLPALGADKYYDSVRVILEYTANNTPYTTTSTQMYLTQGNDMAYIPSLLTQTINVQLIIDNPLIVFDDGIFSSIYNPLFNYPISLNQYDGDTPEDGDGTMKVIITYTERTFGA